MLELAFLGAQVLHPRSVELARKFKIPLEVKSSFEDKPGTRIVEVDQVEKVVVRGVTLDEDIAKITIMEVPDRPGIAFRLFSELAGESIPIDMIIQNVSHDATTNIDFTVPVSDLNDAKEIVKSFKDNADIQDESYDEKICKVSVVGVGMKSHSGVAAKAFSTMAKENINIDMISTSEIKVSMVIDEKYAELAVRSLHNAYELDK